MSNIVKNLVGLALCGLGCLCALAAESSNPAEPQFKWVRSLNASKATEPVVVTVLSTPAPSAPLPITPAASAPQGTMPTLPSPSLASTPALIAQQAALPMQESPSLPNTAPANVPQATRPTNTSPSLPSALLASAPLPSAPLPSAPLPSALVTSAPQLSDAQAVTPASASLAPQSTKDPAGTRKDLSPQKWAILLSDKTLYRTLRRWSQEAQYQLLWQVDRDYPIEAEIVFDNTLREAVAQVMGGVALTDYPLQAIFNPSTRVLRVVRHMDESAR